MPEAETESCCRLGDGQRRLVDVAAADSHLTEFGGDSGAHRSSRGAVLAIAAARASRTTASAFMTGKIPPAKCTTGGPFRGIRRIASGNRSVSVVWGSSSTLSPCFFSKYSTANSVMANRFSARSRTLCSNFLASEVRSHPDSSQSTSR